MTSSFEDPRVLAADESRSAEARANLALKRAKGFLPLWTNLVRSIARNQRLEVALTGGTPRTDGKTVWLKVPIELADFDHERSLCSKWDEVTNEFVCKACNVELQADVNLFHEVGHLVAGSFGCDDPDEELMALCKARWPKAADKFDIVALSIKGKRKPQTPENSLLARMSKSYPDGWGFLALNLVEDSYVNASMIQARPGLGLIFDSGYMQIFRDGNWKDTQPPVVQAMAAWSIIASGRPETLKYLSQEVVDLVLGSHILTEMAERFLTSGKSSRSKIKLIERFKMAVQLLEEFENLGLIQPPEEEKPEPEPSGSEDGDSSEDGKDSDDSSTSGDSSQEEDQDSVRSEDDPSEEKKPESEPEDGSGGESSDKGDSYSDEDDTSSDSVPEGDESEKSKREPKEKGALNGEGEAGFGDHSDSESEGSKVDFSFEAVREALAELTGHDDFGKSASTEEAVSALSSDSETGSLLVAERLDSKIAMDGVLDDQDSIRSLDMELDKVKLYGRILSSDEPNLTDYSLPLSARVGAAQKLRLMFAANKKSGVEHDLTSGRRLDRRTMGSRIPLGDNRIFSARSIPKKRDWTVLMGIDVSGSTSHGNRLTVEKRIAFGMSELLTEVGIPFSVYAHTGSDNAHSKSKKKSRSGYDLIILPLKLVSDTWSSSKNRIANLRHGLFNLDGHTMQAYRKLIEAQSGKDKLLIYFTDGSMPAENAYVERPLLIKEVELLRRKGIHLVCISVDNEEPLRYGIDTIRVDGVEDLPRMIAGIATRLGMKV